MRRMTGPQLEERLRSLARYAKAAGRKLPRITLCCSRDEALKAGATDQNGRLCYRASADDDWTEVVIVAPRKL